MVHAVRAIRSGWVAPLGPATNEFEELLALESGRQNAIALSSGTAALHMGLLALGVREGDYVVCSTLTFVATANAISYVGARPIFVDSEPNSGNISPDLLSEALSQATKLGITITCAIVVDFLGSMADYERIIPLCDKYGIPVLSDAAESVGSARTGRQAGSYGEVAVFSFNGNKVMTTSSGGALLTNNAKVADRVRSLSSQARDPVWYYQHSEVGFNYRLSNVSAAIGVAQIGRLGGMVSTRRRIRKAYREYFAQVPGIRLLGENDHEDNCWLTAIVIDCELVKFTPRGLYDWLDARGIESRPVWKPMHLQPIYRDCLAFLDGTSEALFANGLVLPSGSGLTITDMTRILAEIRGFLGEHKGD